MKKYSFIILSFILVASSCVSKKSFVREQKRVKNLQNDSTAAYSNLKNCNSSLNNSNAKVVDLEREKEGIQKSLSNLSSSSQTTIENSKLTIADQTKQKILSINLKNLWQMR